MLGIVVNRIGADFVRPVEVKEQIVGDRRIPLANLHTDAIAFLEAIPDGQQRHFNLVNLSRYKRRHLAVGVEGHLIGAARRIGFGV